MPKLTFTVDIEFKVKKQDGAEGATKPEPDDVAQRIKEIIQEGLENIEGEEVGDQYEIVETSFDVFDE